MGHVRVIGYRDEVSGLLNAKKREPLGGHGAGEQ